MYATLNPIFLIFSSYGLGVIITEFLLKPLSLYPRLQNHNYISDQLTKQLGVLKFGWLIRNSFMGLFNPNLKYKGKANLTTLQQLRSDMTYAEVNHLNGFILMLIFTLLSPLWGFELWYIVLLIFVNIIFNLYLVFLQQYNKRRINRIIEMNNKNASKD